MFALPRYVIKGGEVVLDDGELRSAPQGRTLVVATRVDPAASREMEAWLTREGTVHPANYVVADAEVMRPVAISGPESR
jgi:formylmethanofuran dehydrogenase subunit A